MDFTEILSLSFFFIFIFIKFLFTKSNRKLNLPPSPVYSLPVIGHIHLLKNPIHKTFISISKSLGNTPIFHLRLGHRLVYVISSHSIAEECFTKNDVVLANRPEIIMGKHLAYDSTMMIAAPYGDHWRNLRRIAAVEIFSSNRINTFMSIRKDEIRRLIMHLSRDSLHKQLTASSSATTATAGKFRLQPPQKFTVLIEKSESLDELFQIHAAILRNNILLHRYPILNLKLQRAYASHGKVRHSLALFHQTIDPDLFLFTVAINTASVNGLYDQAFKLFVQLLCSEIVPNEFTFSSILKSCSIGSVKEIHTHVLKLGLGLDPYVATGLVDVYAKGGDLVSAEKVFDRMLERSLVSSTAMITCYAKQGNVEAARALFDGMSERDIVSWNVMIDGYAQHGFPSEALMLFQKLLAEGKPKPDEITVVASLSACSQIGAVESGRWIHVFIKNSRIKFNVRVCTALIDMYSKCGSLEEAVLVFNDTPKKDIVVWNAMISGYAMHGYSQDALRLFDEMQGIAKLQPTDITFIGTLQACAHGGLVNEGIRIFESMRQEYGIKPKIEHYGCLVSLLGRAGQLKRAYEIIKDMELEADSIIWSSVLGSCKLHGDFVLGKEIAEYLIGENIANSGTYILLSNIYASMNDYEGVAKVRSLMKEKRIVKEPGLSTIEIDNIVHEFRAGDREHSKSKEIYAILRKISEKIKSHYGYVPNTNSVLQDLDETEKAESLQVHSERLAIAYGLISTKHGSPLKIFKNLRVCSDCHTVTKLISKITGRKIVMRDRNRFHHFVNGSCSCGDFW